MIEYCDFCQKEITDQCVTDIDLNMHFHFVCNLKDHEIDELWEYGVKPLSLEAQA